MIIKLLCIICSSSIPYLYSLQGDFVFDDSEAIVKNKDVYSSSWTDPFYNDFWGTNISSNLSHKSYRPLTILSFKLNYMQSEQKLVAHHFKITNLLCHIVCSILAWQAFQKLFETKLKHLFWWDEAFLSALLFSVHPIHVESVSGIVGRADILAGITFFLSFLAYDKAITLDSSLKWLFLITAVMISGMSMLCKENGVTVLGFCMIYEFLTKVGTNKKGSKSKMSAPYLELGSIVRMSVIAMTSFWLLYRRWTLMGGTKPEFKSIDNPAAFANSTLTKISTYNYIYFLNIFLLIWPQWLCFDWSMGCIHLIEGINDYRIIPVVLMYIYGLHLLRAIFDRVNTYETKSMVQRQPMCGRAKMPQYAFKNCENNHHNSKLLEGVSFFRQIILATSLMVIPFLPAANIFYPVGFVIAERVLYISSAGFCSLVVLGLTKIRKKKAIRQIALSVYCILLVILGLRSWQRSLQWRSEYSLFTSGLAVCPLNAKVRYNVAKVADANQESDWALEEYRTAIRLYPEYYQAMNNLANLLKNLKQYEEAEFYLRKAISLKQDFPAAWMNLGIVLANIKRYKESYYAYKTALKHRRNYPDCHYNLGNLHLEINDTKAAMDSWLEAIKLSPKHNLAWTNLLALLDNTGRFQKAVQLIPAALKELPDSPSIHFAIANVYGKMERYEDAERHFLKAIVLFRDSVQAIHYANLGVLYHRWKRYKLAKKMYHKSLLVDPQFRSASKNLDSLLNYLKNN